MEGYYEDKMWFAFELHSRNTFCERNVCEEGGVRNKTRAVSDTRYKVAEKVGL